MKRWKNIKLLKGGKVQLNIEVLKETKRMDQPVTIHEVKKSSWKKQQMKR